ncbi:hypothetical protein ACS0TY_019633 [Phlomoides rotata]
MQAQKEAPADMQCRDKFLLQCVVVSPGSTAKDITAEMFSKESGNHVEECKLRVSYVPPPQPPSPVREGSEEGSSPRATVSDNGTVNQTSDFNTISKGLLDQQESSTEVKALISRLTEEKRSAIQQNNKLQQELELLRRRSRGGGIPFMPPAGISFEENMIDGTEICTLSDNKDFRSMEVFDFHIPVGDDSLIAAIAAPISQTIWFRFTISVYGVTPLP